MYTKFAFAMQIRQNPLWLWNLEETSPEIQNRGTSGPKIGHVNVSDKKNLKKKKNHVPYVKMLEIRRVNQFHICRLESTISILEKYH